MNWSFCLVCIYFSSLLWILVSLNWIPTTYAQNIFINHIKMIIPYCTFLNPVWNGWYWAGVGESNHHGWHQAHLKRQETMVRGKDLWKKGLYVHTDVYRGKSFKFFYYTTFMDDDGNKLATSSKWKYFVLELSKFIMSFSLQESQSCYGNKKTNEHQCSTEISWDRSQKIHSRIERSSATLDPRSQNILQHQL